MIAHDADYFGIPRFFTSTSLAPWRVSMTEFSATHQLRLLFFRYTFLDCLLCQVSFDTKWLILRPWLFFRSVPKFSHPLTWWLILLQFLTIRLFLPFLSFESAIALPKEFRHLCFLYLNYFSCWYQCIS